MATEGRIDWKAVLVRFNHIARERPRGFAKLKARLFEAPALFCPLAVDVALEDEGRMAQALTEVLRELNEPAVAQAVYERLPEHTTVLSQAAVEATEQCLRALTGNSLERLIDRGELYNNLAVRLANDGRDREALTAARSAVAFFRRRARQYPEVFRGYLATSLNTLAVRMADNGLARAALATAKGAVSACRELAGEDPRQYRGDLALSLMTLGNRHSDLGEGDLALDVMREASQIYGLLAEADPGYEGDHALSLFNLANRLTEMGRHEEALPLADRALLLYRRLEASRKDAFYGLTAATLNTLAVNLSDCGQSERALACAREAVERFEDLERRQPSRFLADLVSGCNNLADCEANFGRAKAALQAARKALRYAEGLWRQRGRSATAHLTLALTNLAHRCLQSDRPEEAERLTGHCVQHCRKMVRAEPHKRPELVNALIHRAESLRQLGPYAKARAAAREAVKLARPMARQNLAAFGPRFASAVGTLAICEADGGDFRAALKHQRERVLVSRRLCEISQVVHEAQLAVGLLHLGRLLLECQRPDEAQRALQEAVEILVRMKGGGPSAYDRELAFAQELLRRTERGQAGGKMLGRTAR